jgi:hypothetical protein
MLVISVTISGCSVTTYGFKPKQIELGKYVFTLYYSADATDELIDKKASQVVETIKSEENYSFCSYSRGEMVPKWRNKAIEVNVLCKR